MSTSNSQSRGDNLPVLVSVGDIEVMAKAVSQSGLFGMTQPQAVTLMLLAQAKGIHPISAVERYHVIQGRPAMKADAMLADFQAKGGIVDWHKHDHLSCSATFSAPNLKTPVTVTWTLDDAKKAQLLKNPMWEKYPRQMLRARVISEGIRMAMPGILAGIYTPEEVVDMGQGQGYEASFRVVEERPETKTVTTSAMTREQPREAIQDAPRQPNGNGNVSGNRHDTWAGWIARCVRKATDSWDAEVKVELGQDVKAEPLANQFQLLNHVASRLVEEGAIEEGTIVDPKTGKRDRARTQATVNDYFKVDTDWVKGVVISHIKELRSRERARLGMPDLDSDGGEVPNDGQGSAGREREPGED
jgi:hypothetical protein